MPHAVCKSPVTSPASIPARMAASSETHTLQPLVISTDAHSAPGAEGTVHRQVGDVQQLVGNVEPNRHNAPHQPLGNGAGQRVEKARQCIFPQFRSGAAPPPVLSENRKNGGKGQPFPAVFFKRAGAYSIGRISLRHGDAQRLADDGVELGGEVFGISDGHGGDVRLARQDLEQPSCRWSRPGHSS